MLFKLIKCITLIKCNQQATLFNYSIQQLKECCKTTFQIYKMLPCIDFFGLLSLWLQCKVTEAQAEATGL